jgi:diadenosine tetraphosphate (Ap4A) HIT family hydrolase
VFAVKDKHPVTPGHLLAIPVRHTSDFFAMTEAERTDANQLLRLCKTKSKLKI